MRSGMGVPMEMGAKPPGLAGAWERHGCYGCARFFRFVTQFRPPVYSTPQSWTVEDGFFGHVRRYALTRVINTGEAVRGSIVFETAEVEYARNVGTGQGDPVVMRRLETLEP